MDHAHHRTHITFKKNEEVQYVLIRKYSNILTLKHKMQNSMFRMLPFVGRKKKLNT